MKTAKPERLFVFQCDKLLFTFYSHSQILSNLVRVGIDRTPRRVIIAITWFHQSKSNANFPIIFDVTYIHFEVLSFICFVCSYGRMLVYIKFMRNVF